MELDRIVITGARQHNLRNVTVEIPKKKLVVLTGVSGSGKSSLAFDTLYAEGQRRYIESLCAYARQFLGQMEKPLYDSIKGLAPTISIEQKTASTNPRSTVGTITEIHDYLRVLWARVGRLSCHQLRAAGLAAVGPADRPRDPRAPGGDEVPRPRAPREGQEGRAPRGDRAGPQVRLHPRAGGRHRALPRRRDPPRQEEEALDRRGGGPPHRQAGYRAAPDRLGGDGAPARRGHRGRRRRGKARTWSSPSTGPATTAGSPSRSPRRSSSPSTRPRGCARSAPASARGWRWTPSSWCPNPDLSVNEGAVKPLGAVGEATTWGSDIVRAVARERGIDLNRPWQSLSAEQRRVILLRHRGRAGEHPGSSSSWGTGSFRMRYEGAINSMMRRMRETKSEDMRQYYQKFLSSRPCSVVRRAADPPRGPRREDRGPDDHRDHRALGGRRLRLLRRAPPQGSRREDRGRAPEGDPLAPPLPARRGPHLPDPRPRPPPPSPAARASGSGSPARSAPS